MIDLRGNYVQIANFSLTELRMVEERLKELGVDTSVDPVGEENLRAYGDDYYGIDGDNEAMFYTCRGNFAPGSGGDVGPLTKEEFCDLIELDLETLEEKVSLNISGKLYKVVAYNGKTYYFASDTALKEVIKADNIGDARADLAVLVVDVDGHILKNRFTPTQLIETNFNIEDI